MWDEEEYNWIKNHISYILAFYLKKVLCETAIWVPYFAN